MKEIEIERLYTPIEASHFLKIGSDTIRQLARKGKISFRRIGNRYQFSAEDLNNYLAGNKGSR